jgi:arabinogalactan oligomer/maltooligosaccharide transport system substrate-binding protein
LLLLATCGAASAQKSVTAWTPFTDSDLKWLQDQAASFQKGFGVTVNVVQMKLGDIKQKMLLSASKGEAADLLAAIPHSQLSEMAAAGVLADVTRYATTDYLAGLNPQARLAFTYSGTLFGLPLYVEGPALIVNTNMVKEAPQTFQDFLDTARKLTTGTTSGFMFDAANFYFAYVFIHSLGGYIFARSAQGVLQPSDSGLANEGAVKGAQLIKEMRFKYKLLPASVNTQVAEDAFTRGRLAMIYDGPWEIPNIREARIPIAVTPLPPLDGKAWSGFMNAQGVLINQYSKDKIDAVNFAKWLTRPDAQAALARASGHVPASQEAAKATGDPIIAGFAAALADSEPTPNIPAMGNVWQAMDAALANILKAPDANVKQELQHAVSQIESQSKGQ